MRSFIPWVGGKGKLLWLIDRLAPAQYSRFIDVFGGSGTVLMSRPVRRGCMEVYNDYNSNLTNLFYCVKERPLSLLLELSFLPLNARDEFDVLLSHLNQEEFDDSALTTELELAERMLPELHANAVKKLLLKRAQRGSVRRAADYYKLIRYSFSGGGKSFGGKPCNIRHFFYQIWQCSRRLEDVIIENKDFEELLSQYDREDAFIYCDPPYYKAECYEIAFSKKDHYRLRDAVRRCRGYVMVSYNYCSFIVDLYRDFYVFRTTRPNSMSQKAGSEYEEVIITNYDPRQNSHQLSLFGLQKAEYDMEFQMVNLPLTTHGNTKNGKLTFTEEMDEI